MKRILDLQKLEQPKEGLLGLAASTSSRRHCTCSTCSDSCTIETDFVAI